MGKRSDQGGWPPSGFGVALKEERERAGLSQEQLAQKAGCSLFTISRLERGHHEPAWPLVIAVAKVLGVSTEALKRDDVPSGGQPAPPGRPRKKSAPDTPTPPLVAEEAKPARRKRGKQQ